MSWIYSFTRPGYVEDVEEYNIFKKLLSTWIKSSKVTELLGEETSLALQQWLLDNVFPYEEYFCLLQKDALTNILSVNNKSPRRNQFWAQISQCFRETVPRHGQSWKSHVIARFFEGRNAFSCNHLLYDQKARLVFQSFFEASPDCWRIASFTDLRKG